MNQILMYFFMAIGLSMDAFSLALAYGVNNPKLKKCLLISTVVGLFHFFMPHIGSKIGILIINNVIINTNIFVSIIFFSLALEMLFNKNEEQNKTIENIFSIILFSFAVSIDSLSVGVALGITKANTFIASLLFSVVSCFFTFLGLLIGKKMSQKFGQTATYIGIIILLFLALKYLF